MVYCILEINQSLEWTVCHGRVVTLSHALYHAPSQLFKRADEEEIIDAVVQYSKHDRVWRDFSFYQYLFSYLLVEILRALVDSNIA